MGKRQSDFTEASTLDNAEVSGFQGSGAGAERRFPIALYDARYYTRALVDTALAGKADISHGHDDSEITAAASASNYTPASATVEGHLSGIDDALALAGGGDVTNPMTADLDVGGFSIVSSANGDIVCAPNGTGNVVVGNFTFDADQVVGAGTDGYALVYRVGTGLVALEAQSGSGGGNSVEVEGSASMPASIPAGGSVEVVVPGMTGITNAAWVISLLHVPSTSAEIDRYAVITANDQATVTLTNIGTTAITGLSGNITVRARTLAGTPGLSGTAAMPASIPAGGSVEVTVTVTGATTNYAVPFVHVPSTNAEIERYGVVTAADQVTVVLTNTSTTEISGLTGNITVKAESI